MAGRKIGSAEEIAVFENGTAVSEAGLSSDVQETARPGVPMLDVWRTGVARSDAAHPL